MCQTFNTIGSLTTLKSKLKDNNIQDFNSLKEVMDFLNAYPKNRKQLLTNHEHLIVLEKDSINAELQSLDATISSQKQQTEQILKTEIENLKLKLINISNTETSNIFKKVILKLKANSLKRKINHLESNSENKILGSVSNQILDQQIKQSRFQYLISNTSEAVNQSAHFELSELDRKKSIIESLKSFIFGAIGEQKVVKALESLSDDYFLINDFNITFSPALYSKKDNDYIKSIQIDHILVGPFGIFLIETKNWSEKSIENLDLRSPVDQIERSSYVLYRLLHNDINNYRLYLNNHHWGSKKISIKNLIVLTKSKPKEEFQFVKILNLNELVGYVNYFKPIFTNIETKKIADYLLEVNAKKRIRTK